MTTLLETARLKCNFTMQKYILTNDTFKHARAQKINFLFKPNETTLTTALGDIFCHRFASRIVRVVASYVAVANKRAS